MFSTIRNIVRFFVAVVFALHFVTVTAQKRCDTSTTITPNLGTTSIFPQIVNVTYYDYITPNWNLPISLEVSEFFSVMNASDYQYHRAIISQNQPSATITTTTNLTPHDTFNLTRQDLSVGLNRFVYQVTNGCAATITAQLPFTIDIRGPLPSNPHFNPALLPFCPSNLPSTHAFVVINAIGDDDTSSILWGADQFDELISIPNTTLTVRPPNPLDQLYFESLPDIMRDQHTDANGNLIITTRTATPYDLSFIFHHLAYKPRTPIRADWVEFGIDVDIGQPDQHIPTQHFALRIPAIYSRDMPQVRQDNPNLSPTHLIDQNNTTLITTIIVPHYNNFSDVPVMIPFDPTEYWTRTELFNNSQVSTSAPSGSFANNTLTAKVNHVDTHVAVWPPVVCPGYALIDWDIRLRALPIRITSPPPTSCAVLQARYIFPHFVVLPDDTAEHPDRDSEWVGVVFNISRSRGNVGVAFADDFTSTNITLTQSLTNVDHWLISPAPKYPGLPASAFVAAIRALLYTLDDPDDGGDVEFTIQATSTTPTTEQHTLLRATFLHPRPTQPKGRIHHIDLFLSPGAAEQQHIVPFNVAEYWIIPTHWAIVAQHGGSSLADLRYDPTAQQLVITNPFTQPSHTFFLTPQDPCGAPGPDFTISFTINIFVPAIIIGDDTARSDEDVVLCRALGSDAPINPTTTPPTMAIFPNFAIIGEQSTNDAAIPTAEETTLLFDVTLVVNITNYNEGDELISAQTQPPVFSTTHLDGVYFFRPYNSTNGIEKHVYETFVRGLWFESSLTPDVDVISRVITITTQTALPTSSQPNVLTYTRTFITHQHSPIAIHPTPPRSAYRITTYRNNGTFVASLPAAHVWNRATQVTDPLSVMVVRVGDGDVVMKTASSYDPTTGEFFLRDVLGAVGEEMFFNITTTTALCSAPAPLAVQISFVLVRNNILLTGVTPENDLGCRVVLDGEHPDDLISHREHEHHIFPILSNADPEATPSDVISDTTFIVSLIGYERGDVITFAQNYTTPEPPVFNATWRDGVFRLQTLDTTPATLEVLEAALRALVWKSSVLETPRREFTITTTTKDASPTPPPTTLTTALYFTTPEQLPKIIEDKPLPPFVVPFEQNSAGFAMEFDLEQHVDLPDKWSTEVTVFNSYGVAASNLVFSLPTNTVTLTTTLTVETINVQYFLRLADKCGQIQYLPLPVVVSPRQSGNGASDINSTNIVLILTALAITALNFIIMFVH